MRIVMVQEGNYLSAVGGSAKASRCLMEGLAANKHECVVVCRPWVPTKRALFAERFLGAKSARVIRGVKATELNDNENFLKCAQETLKSFSPDVVLFEGRHDLLKFVLELAPRRTFFLAHTQAILPFGPGVFAPNEAFAQLLRRVPGVIAVSEYIRKFLQEHGGVSSRMVRFPTFGTGPFENLGRFDGPGAVTLVNPCEIKGISIFLELARRFPKHPFIAVPTWGTSQPDLKALRAQPNVKLVPPSPDIDDILRRTKVLIAPSLWQETFGNVVVEAMLRGIPTMASNVGGLPESKLGVDYLIPVRPIERFTDQRYTDGWKLRIPEVPPQDITPWVNGLRELTENRARYEEVAARSRTAGEAFLKTVGIAPFEDYFASVIAKA